MKFLDTPDELIIRTMDVNIMSHCWVSGKLFLPARRSELSRVIYLRRGTERGARFREAPRDLSATGRAEKRFSFAGEESPGGGGRDVAETRAKRGLAHVLSLSLVGFATRRRFRNDVSRPRYASHWYFVPSGLPRTREFAGVRGPPVSPLVIQENRQERGIPFRYSRLLPSDPKTGQIRSSGERRYSTL